MKVVIKRPVNNSYEKVYKNLRSCYDSLVTELLGEGYYTLSSDVYNSDKECYIDMKSYVHRLKANLKLSIILNVVFIVFILILGGIICY